MSFNISLYLHILLMICFTTLLIPASAIPIFYSLQSLSTHFIYFNSTMMGTIISICYQQYSINTLNWSTNCSPSTTFTPSTQQLRTSDSNTAISNNIVVFDTANIYLSNNLTGNYVTVLTLISVTAVNGIYDVAMSSINNKMSFSLSVEASFNTCYVTMYNGLTSISQFSTGITVSAAPSFSKIVPKTTMQ